MSALPLEQEIEYPTSDGQPMAETPEHLQVMFDLIFGLQSRYVPMPDVWVGGNLFLCYERGNPKACVAPDVLLTQGIGKWNRPNYLLWKEGPPNLVVEVTSPKTRRKDQDFKKPLYEKIGVEEYVLFDPLEEYLQPRLQGHRLWSGRFQPISLEKDGSLLSRTTGLWMCPEGKRLRLVDAATREPLLWPDEVEAARVQEAEARRAAEEATHIAEEARRAEADARMAAEARADEESAARREAEERLRALEQELSRLRKAGS
jgi:Uma2 family endonuclease